MSWRPEQVIQLQPDPSERIGPLSECVWCDYDDPETNVKGQLGHPMSTKDPDRRHFTQTQNVNVPTGNSYGRPTYQETKEVTEVLDMCGYHWRKKNMFQDTPKAITETEIEAATAEARMWEARYRADHPDE